MKPRLSPAVGVALGVLAVSTSSVLIRLADAPPLAIGAWRLAIAAAIVLPLALLTERWALARLTRADLLAAAASAALLAIHFAFWIASLSYTSVASSTVIVTSNPLLVAIAAPLLTGDPLRRRAVVGILVALAGGLVIAAADLRVGGTALFGNALALVGAAGVAGYYVSGRRLRTRLPALTYTAVVYPITAVLLTLAALATSSPLTGHSPRTMTMIFLLALFPQIIGHSMFNWALGYLPAVTVSATVMAEPAAASLLALLLLGEAPSVAELAGGALILAGVGLVLTAPAE
ncbi:MAG: DMT family transporter, partial [Chloroflexi bacterium]|nr:DMT family transporter [Chloroflexota bacterium]